MFKRSSKDKKNVENIFTARQTSRDRKRNDAEATLNRGMTTDIFRPLLFL